MALTDAAISQLQTAKPSERKRESISGGSVQTIFPLLQNAFQVLSRYQDSLAGEFGDSVYEQMANDAHVEACLDILVSLILASPLRVIAAPCPKETPEYETAAEVAEFIKVQLAGLDRPLSLAMREALTETLIYGSALSEIVMKPATKDGRAILRLADLKTKSRRWYRLVTDRFYTLVGAINVEAGGDYSTIYSGATQIDETKLIPRQKFMNLVIQSRNGDPRGRSSLRSAWAAYYMKTNIWPKYEKYLVQFSNPSLIGYTAPNAGDVENEDTGLYDKSSQEEMLAVLLQFQAGSAAVFENGAKVEPLEMNSNGEVFDLGFRLFDTEIAKAILKSPRVVMEAKYSSRADGETAGDVVETYVTLVREIVSGIFKNDVVKELVRVNYGDDFAERFTPNITMERAQKQDFAKVGQAISALFTSGYLHESQIPGLDTLLGLPERDFEAWVDEREDMKESAAYGALERAKMQTPGLNGENAEEPDTTQETEEEDGEETEG